MHGAATLDFDLRRTEVPPSFPVGFPNSGGVPDDVSDCELGNSDFQDQLERTVNSKQMNGDIIAYGSRVEQ